MAQIADHTQVSDIWNVLFKDRRWLLQAREDRIIPLLIGTPEKLDPDKELYLILLLATDDGKYPFLYMSQTGPLFRECLNDHLIDENRQLKFNRITLNIDVFYNVKLNFADIDQIRMPNLPATNSDDVAPFLVNTTVYTGFEEDNKIGDILAWHLGDIFLVLLRVSNNDLIWTFSAFSH